MSAGAGEGETLVVPFDGPHARLRLAFEASSFVPAFDPEAWPRATATYEGGGLSGTVRVDFFPGSVRAFAQALAASHRDLRGAAALESEDGDFRLAVTFGHSGQLALTGHLQPDVLSGTKLLYEIDTDQSYLNASLLALRALPG